MKTINRIPTDNLKWHLQNNVYPTLTDKTIDRVIDTINSVNSGEIKLSDEIVKGSGVSVSEMLEDLRIEF